MYLKHFADVQITKKKLKLDKQVSAHQILSGSILFMPNKGIFLNLRSISELRRSPGSWTPEYEREEEHTE